MKARNNPTHKQFMERMRRKPEPDQSDPRNLNDPYYALRLQGFSHSYAKRAFRGKKPTISNGVVDHSLAGDASPQDLLLPHGSVLRTVMVKVRPLLTDEVIATMEADEVEYVNWDDKVRSLGVRVRPNGHKSWVKHYRLAGKSQKITIGDPAHISLEEARTIGYWINCEVEEGRDPKRLRDPDGAFKAPRKHSMRRSCAVTPMLPRSMPEWTCNQNADDDVEL